MIVYNDKKINDVILSKRIILFMNGSDNKPKCWFSMCALEILKMCNTEFRTINVLERPRLKEAVKKYSCWPMFPQLFIDGEFIGGSHVMIEMYQSRNLQKIIHNL